MGPPQSWLTQCAWLLLTCLNSGLMAGSAAAMLEYNGSTIMSKNCVQQGIRTRGYVTHAQRQSMPHPELLLQVRHGWVMVCSTLIHSLKQSLVVRVPGTNTLFNYEARIAQSTRGRLTPGWLLVMPVLERSMSGDTG